jgi:Ala-tRNA(Pro) deacylase
MWPVPSGNSPDRVAAPRIPTQNTTTMIAKKLKDYLDSFGVKYVTVTHSLAFTAHEVAVSAHVPDQEMAKTVIVNVKGELAMAVLPASYHIDFHRLMDSLKTGNMYLATEAEFKNRFPDCEIGAMPPFGNLYGMKTYVSQSLTEDEQITFNAGSHSEAITMSYADYARLVAPIVVSFTDRPRD